MNSPSDPLQPAEGSRGGGAGYSPEDSVGFGLAMGLGINFFLLVTCFFSALFTPYSLYFLEFYGVIQLLYMVPLILWARRRRLPSRMKGLIIAVSITFLLNAACDAVFLPVVFHHS